MGIQRRPRKIGPSCFPLRKKVRSRRKRISGWQVFTENRERRKQRSVKCRNSKGYKAIRVRPRRPVNSGLLSSSLCGPLFFVVDEVKCLNHKRTRRSTKEGYLDAPCTSEDECAAVGKTGKPSASRSSLSCPIDRN